jgi:glutamate synthase (NADPH/NADH) large chain
VSHAEQTEAGQIEIWHSPARGSERETDDTILRRLIENHYRYTGSFLSRDLLADWPRARSAFVKVMPKEYRRALKELWAAANPEQIAA